MSQFHYRAVSDTGDILHGEMEAASVDEVIARLQDQGHTPLEARPANEAGSAGSFGGLFKRGPFTGDQLAQFTHQLATLLGAGQPLDRALGILLDLPEGERAKKLIERVRDRVRGGTTLSQAFDEEHGVFPKLYISLVRAGEAGGSLEDTLRRLADYLERSQQLRGSIVNALIYPAFLMVGVLGSLVLLLAYVVPQFVPIFEDMQVPIPLVTQAVLALGNLIQSWWWLLALLIGGGIFVWRARMRDPAYRLAWHGKLLQKRVVGPLLLKVETARIARTLGTLVKNGVPLLSALTIARQVTSNRALDEALAQAAEQVKGGSGLSLALAQSQRFPRLALQMVQVGEEAGQLDTMLLKVADTFELESKRAIDRLLAALVPALTIVMTILVAIIMAAILLPLLSLTSNIQ
ncbi:type II secretion system inner membrane protein GspF [Dyella sp. LX-66]|uniref:type II secretion system inner membrane protein GspF n=1 Tax=unclassified Dyella TaxID=2634549 RepID=UPI001BDFB89F|nr:MULTISPECIES: type II secretion system inner membrane protein GspF [unclassified Dyella]MBT2117513.1 type II secretion system inner membrane protein GspF [Dyella sp. LX-1]MBT2119358.1 type II secretion system inner membrane protein GspF [Dyella sp. LX-1]MBT2138577.1 type II secretion system inner membrane protein GspF [Dyella sp. LX-66]